MAKVKARTTTSRKTKTSVPGGGRKNPPKGYPKSASQYADPEDKAYPLDTAAHVRNAAARFAQNKDRYSFVKRMEIARNIAKAEKRMSIGKNKPKP